MGRQKSTLDQYKRMKLPILNNVGNFHVEKMCKNNCDLIRNDCRKMGESRERAGIITLRKILQFASNEGKHLKFYWKDIELPKYVHKPVEYLSKDDIREIRETLDNDMADTEWKEQKYHNALKTRVIFELILHTGLRIGEVCSLSWKDVFLDVEEMKVKNIKNHKIQLVYTTGATHWLRKYYEYTKDLKSEAVFLSSGLFGRGVIPKRMTTMTAKKCAFNLSKKLGWKKRFHWHMVRKTYCTELLRGKADIKTVQWLARHESPQTTMGYYLAVDRENAKEIHANIMCCI